MVMLSKEEHRAVSVYHVTKDLYKAARTSGLSPSEVLRAVGTYNLMLRSQGTAPKCKTCRWHKDGLPHCILPNCFKDGDL